MSGADITADVQAAYVEAGIAAGNGTGAPIVTINRPGEPTGPEWNPTPGTPVVHTFTAKPAAKAYTQRTGLALGAGELVYSLVNHGVTITPAVLFAGGQQGLWLEVVQFGGFTPGTSDVLTIDGINWPVQEVIPMDSAGFVISWLVKVSK